MKLRHLRPAIVATVCLLAASLQLSSSISGSPAATPRRAVRVLFVGNSYTIYNDLPWVTEQLVRSAGEARPLEAESVSMMGATLKEHWLDGFALKRIREGGPWDYVVLQGQSRMPLTDPEGMNEYALRFDAEIKAAGARTVLFVTWSRHEHPEQQASITAVYERLARETGAMTAPVGPAWHSALEESPALRLYRDDADNHPTAAGTYLAACVIYSTLYGKSPEGLTAEISDAGMGRHQFDPAGDALKAVKEEPFALSSSEALFLQRKAWALARPAGAR